MRMPLFASLLQEEWFGDPDAVRNKVGLIDEQPSTRRAEASGWDPGCRCCFFCCIALVMRLFWLV